MSRVPIKWGKDSDKMRIAGFPLGRHRHNLRATQDDQYGHQMGRAGVKVRQCFLPMGFSILLATKGPTVCLGLILACES